MTERIDVDVKWLNRREFTRRCALCSKNVGIGAQSTLGGHKIFARKICIKISTKYPNFT